MSRPTVEVADILRAQGNRFLDRYEKSFDFQQLKAFRAIQRCRTAALGGHIDACPRCGYQAAISYNSCRNRHCPKCQTQARERWLAARERDLLATDYFHVVFTVPHELNVLALDNPRLFYDLLFNASAQTLLEVAADPRHLGAEIGLISILHTWWQNLLLHPHVHCAIPAGGLSPDQEARVEAWLDRLDLLRLAEANPFTLSQGQKRRLSVAAMLIRGQDVLILDEPTLGQDELQATRLMAMMATLQREGKTVIMVTHDMRLVSENADALVVLSEGRVLYQGEPGAYFADPGLVKRCGLAVPVLGRMAAEMQQDHGVSARLNTLDAILKAAGSAMASSPATSAGPATTAGSATTASLGSTAHPGAAGPSTTAGPGGGAAAAARQTGRES